MKEKKKKSMFQNFITNFLTIISVRFVCFLLLIALILVIMVPKTYKKNIRIMYKEFPFKIVYEIDNKENILEDTWIIKYKSTTQYIDIGERINWDINLKSGRKK